MVQSGYFGFSPRSDFKRQGFVVVNNTDSGVKVTGFEFQLQDCVASGELGLPLGALVFSFETKEEDSICLELGMKAVRGVCVCPCVRAHASLRTVPGTRFPF